MKTIKELLKKHNRIIIHRHSKPDMDAIGSQMGLMHIIKENFPEKEVYVVGDHNKFDYENAMNEIPDSFYKDSLVFITDVAVSYMISDNRYLFAKDVVIIDHHENKSDVAGAHVYSDPTYEAAAAYVYDIAKKLKLKIPAIAADYLLNGIITDSGRFQYLTNAPRIFQIAAELTALGANPLKFYKWLYVETLEEHQTKAKFATRMQIEGSVAYFFNNKEFLESLGSYDFFSISRGMVNLLAGIKEIPIWANFTYSVEQDKVICELRSREIEVVHIAKKYGGGGHALACGATLDNFEVAKAMIKDLNELILQNQNK